MIDCLNHRSPLTGADLGDIEDYVFGAERDDSSIEARLICRLIDEVRRLTHELADPRFLYSGRIHRNAILCREAQIDRLRAEIERLTPTPSKEG